MHSHLHDRCNENDWRQFFSLGVDELRWLSNTLTGDEELATKILSAALEQSLKGTDRIFRDWMVRWARRLIILVCVETVRPAASIGLPCHCQVHGADLKTSDPGSIEVLFELPRDLLQQKLLRLDALRRFTFVLRAIERYSRRETALLLNIDDRICEAAYLQACISLQEGDSNVTPMTSQSELSVAFQTAS